MYTSRRSSLITRLLLALLLLAISCFSSAANPPRIAVTIKPVHSLVAALLEGIAEPELIIRDGSPLDYLPGLSQLESLSKADLVIWTGPELEPGLEAYLSSSMMQSRTMELLDIDDIKILASRAGSGRDPYFWLDTRNMLILTDILTSLLIEKDPARTHRYQENHERLVKRLSQIDRELEYRYRNVSSNPVFLYHDTQQYFEQAYAMKAGGIVSATPGASNEKAAENLLAVRNALSDAPRACLLTEAAFDEPHIDLLSGAKNLDIVELDSLGVSLDPGPGHYVRLMKKHYNAISSCIGNRGHSLMEEESTAAASAAGHRIEGKYLLLDHFGETVSNADMHGSYQLVYFGYTYCPDICPTSLSKMAAALKLLGNKIDRLQPLFVTLDPDRDTPDVLRDYVSYFHPKILGLTGSDKMIARTADQFHVRYEKVIPEGQPPDRYVVDHTSSMVLLGPEGEFLAKFAYGMPANELAEKIGQYLDR